MKCEVIRDLLFLYEENGCSDESRKLVEEHLRECEACRNYQKKMRFPEQMMQDESEPDKEEIKPEKKLPNEEKVIKKCFRKIRRRWAASLAAVVMIVPIVILGIMGWNEYQKEEGICFTNLDELYDAYRFMGLVEDEAYEQAAEMISYERSYFSIMEALEEAEKPFDLYDKWTTLTINGETWVMSYYISDYSSVEWKPNQEEETWLYQIYNGWGSIMVPEEVWNDVIGVENMEQVIYNDIEGYVPCGTDPVNDTVVFYPVETKWGNYYISGHLAREMQEKGTLSAEEFVRIGDLVPECILKAAEEELRAEYNRNAESTQKYYGAVKDMTCEEFCGLMKQKFVENVRQFKESGATFEKLRFRYIRNSGHWRVGFDLAETDANGSKWEYTLDIGIENGRIFGIQMTYASSEADRRRDSLAAALNVLYWDGF